MRDESPGPGTPCWLSRLSSRKLVRSGRDALWMLVAGSGTRQAARSASSFS
ncbi:hypothetical protein ACFPRL_05455 [Pseudoclavibacter helvolus]